MLKKLFNLLLILNHIQMLNLKHIVLIENKILIDAHPVEVKETTAGGIQRATAEIEEEKRNQVMRTGVIIAQGKLDNVVKERLSTILSKGKDTDIDPNTLQAEVSLIGKTVIFAAHGVDKFDLPIEGTNVVLLTNADYILAELLPDNTQVNVNV
jgi:hypothetical protein